MYKIKFPPKEKEIIQQTLGIRDSEPYEIVLAPETSLSEADKINIVFGFAELDNVKQKIQFFANTTPMVLTGKTYRGEVRVEIRDIDYIESYGNDITAYVDKKRVELPLKLYELSEQLEPFGFCRISKSMIVNIAKITSIQSGFNGKLTIELSNGTELEVNRSYKKSFRDYLKEN